MDVIEQYYNTGLTYDDINVISPYPDCDEEIALFSYKNPAPRLYKLEIRGKNIGRSYTFDEISKLYSTNNVEKMPDILIKDKEEQEKDTQQKIQKNTINQNILEKFYNTNLTFGDIDIDNFCPSKYGEENECEHRLSIGNDLDLVGGGTLFKKDNIKKLYESNNLEVPEHFR